MKTFCKGDNHNIECPHCGKINHYVCHGKVVEFGKIAVFSKHCFHCGKIVWYQAGYEIAVTAEQNSVTGNPGS